MSHPATGSPAERAVVTALPEAAVWRQLGEMLLRAREDLDPRYAGRRGLTLFANERGINRRVAWDIENAKRDNYSRAMLRDIESAYGLERRAISDFLARFSPDGHEPALDGSDMTVGEYQAALGSLTPAQKNAIARAFIEVLERVTAEREENGGKASA